jgi:superfamily II DNA/RNA helicase
LKTFAELGFSKPILAVLQEAGFTEPTEIQEKTAGIILDGGDVLASAHTGSGKTAAFALPIIERLEKPARKPRALVLAPTRELALQVEAVFKQFGRTSGLKTVTLYGGTGYGRQIMALKKQVDIIVATPGRLLDCVERRFADLSGIEVLVLDEADRLLNLGFMPQLRRIINQLSKERQTLMFSATIDRQVSEIARDYLRSPVRVSANVEQLEVPQITQKFVEVNEFGKDAMLVKLIKDHDMTSVLIFARTKRKTTWVMNKLRYAGVRAEEIHGDISQSQREKTLKGYRDGLFPVLVATDVASRGLDIPTITHVVNYDLPENAEDYVHRIGRTGRAGREGMALSLVSIEQRHLLRDIEKLIGPQNDIDSGTVKKVAGRRFRPRYGGRR